MCWQLAADTVVAAEVKRPIYMDVFLRLTARSAQAAIHEGRPEGLSAKSQTKRRPARTRQTPHTSSRSQCMDELKARIFFSFFLEGSLESHEQLGETTSGRKI